jgi:hypothetical protein
MISHGNSFQVLAQLSSIEEQIETTDAQIVEMMETNRQLTEKIAAIEFTTQTYINECVVYERMIQQIRNRTRTDELKRAVLGTHMTRAKIESQLMKARTWSNDDWYHIDDEDMPYFAECAIKAAEYDLQLELELAKDIMMGLVV